MNDEHTPAQADQSGWVDRSKWDPSLEKFERFLAREVEMAKEKILNHQEPILHSTRSVSLAQAEIAAEGLAR